MNPNTLRQQDRRLLKEVAAVLLVKISIIFALWFFFFSPSHRPEQTPEAVANAVLNKAAGQSMPDTAGETP